MTNREDDILAHLEDTQLPASSPNNWLKEFWKSSELMVKSLFRQVLFFFQVRDEIAHDERLRKAHEAELGVVTTSLTTLEEKAGADIYAYPQRNTGYHVNKRFRKPKSRSQERAGQERALQNIARRIQEAELATSAKE